MLYSEHEIEILRKIMGGDSNKENEEFPDRNNTDYPVSVLKYMEKIKHDTHDVLQYHQKIVQQFFIDSKNRGLLIYHGTGMGKTMLAVAISDVMKQHRQVIILSPKSLQTNFKKEIHKYMKLLDKKHEDTEKSIDLHYKFVSSNASNVLKQLENRNKSKDEIKFEKDLEISNNINLEGTLVIIDEAQNFFNAVTNKSGNAMGMYNAIMNAKNIKLVFLSATPIINDPFEISPIFNMLYGGRLLPESLDDFHNLYIDSEKNSIKNRDKLKNRIFGLLSYTGDWWRTGGILKQGEIIKREHFPDQYPTIIEKVQMSSEQYSAYSIARDAEKMSNSSVASSSYRMGSRQISNFLVPEIAKTKIIDTKKYIKNIDKITDYHFERLEIFSPKMKKVYENICKHPGLSVVYSSFVSGEGLKIFSKILEYYEWEKFDIHQTNIPEKKKYAIMSGEVATDERDDIIARFISKDNINGDNIKLLMISSVGSEGLDLRNVRSVHIIEPYWNYGRIEQIIARAVRYKSHIDYEDEKDKNVQPYIYLSDYPANYVFKPTKREPKNEKTTDVYLYDRSIKNKQLIDKMYATMIEASIDCSIHIKTAPKNIQQKIKCLMCNPTHEKMFHPDINIDMKIENPCVELSKSTVNVEEIIYLDKSYYYKKDDNGNILIYEFSDLMGHYVEMNRSNKYYDILIEKISELNY